MTTPMPELPETDYMLGGKGYSGSQMLAYAIAAIEAATLAERERCAKEAEHWQTISATPGHACGQYIAAAIRLPLPPTATPQGKL